jgi:hypothetical protein
MTRQNKRNHTTKHMQPPSDTTPAASTATVTVKIHGAVRTVSIDLNGMSVQQFVERYKDTFGIPDNATPLVNGREGEALKEGDTLTFQTRASSKA